MSESPGAVLARKRWKRTAGDRCKERAAYLAENWRDVHDEDRAEILDTLNPILQPSGGVD